MRDLIFYDTAARAKRTFQPHDPNRVTMYVCGPTVYARAHIGNARPVVVFDVLFRLLRHQFGAEHVVYVRNITDIDDKIIAAAAASNRSTGAVTAETTQWFHADIAQLGVLPPTHEPRATEFVPQMVTLIEQLVINGFAYEAEGHVLFHTSTDKQYGSLAQRSVAEMQAGARVEVAPYKRDPTDFVLWKPSAADVPGWDSPWGRGRPGWHIECSAMSNELLGDSFDIHAGGIDLVFPHHENECAQSRCANPGASFANYWMHNGYLLVEGEKMAKSVGNVVTVDELLREYPGEVMRFALLATHYRQPFDWTKRGLEEARTVLQHWRRVVDQVPPAATVPDAVVAALADDLNTPQAITEMHRLAHQHDGPGLRAAGELMGLLTDELGDWAAERAVAPKLAEQVDQLVRRRSDARQRKDYVMADRIREQLMNAGIEVADLVEGTVWSATAAYSETALASLMQEEG